MTQDCAGQLIAWTQRRLEHYTNVTVQDLTSSFRDGMVLAALTHFMRCDSMPYTQLAPANVQHNLNLAISKALQFCNIPGLMDVDDFVAAGGPDEASLMTYLAEFLKYYRKKWGRKGFMPAHNRYALPPSGAATASLSGSPAKRSTAGWEIKYKDLRIDKEIGRGAFGQVFKGSWRMQPVAIKQLLISGEKLTESELAEFMGECELMMTLRPHKNVVLLLGVCCDPAQPFCLVTDFQANGSLHQLLKSDREIGWETTLRVLEGVAAGMYHIHEEKILHRDLAARNVLLSSSMDAMVADFGLSAKTAGGATQESYFRGALKYMAPESLRNNMFSTKSDVWSFGVLTWEVLTRAAPFADLNLQDAARKIKKGLTLPLPVDCPSPLALILEQCWCQEPESRPSFDQFVAHFNTIRREMGRYPQLPLLLPGEASRTQRAAVGIGAAASSVPAREARIERNETARHSLDSHMMTQTQLDAVALFNRRKEAQQAGAELQAGATDAAVMPRANSGNGGGGGGGSRGSSGRGLIAGAGDVNAAAAAASAQYATTQQLVDSQERSGGSRGKKHSISSVDERSLGSQAAAFEAGYGATGGVAPQAGGAAEYGVGPAEVESGYGPNEPTVHQSSGRDSSPGVRAQALAARHSIAGVAPSADSDSDDDDIPARRATINSLPYDEDDAGNQYDSLPTELEKSRRETIQTTLAIESASTLLVGVKSATMQLPSRTVKAQTLIGSQRANAESPRRPSGSATLDSLPSIRPAMTKAAAAPSVRNQLPTDEYSAVEAPRGIRDDSSDDEKPSNNLTLAQRRAQEAEEAGYGLAPPEKAASGKKLTLAQQRAQEAEQAGYGVPPPENEYGLPPPERDDGDDDGEPATSNTESTGVKKKKKKSKDASAAPTAEGETAVKKKKKKKSVDTTVTAE
jgi:serine/threonine protein kinase